MEGSGKGFSCMPSLLSNYNIVREKRVLSLRVGGGGLGGLQPPKLGSNPFHSGKFSERTVGISDRKLTAPLNLTSMVPSR